jgi:phosphate/sulfate permease
MNQLFDTPVGAGAVVLLVGALVVACAFEFVNGFHDTANAVATVIYTKSLKPWMAVGWSGLCNFLGVYVGGIAVAMSILKLLPVELLTGSGNGAALAMVLALLTAAILWNLGTWWLGLPSSSSHTLIGAIVGVGLANSMLPGHVFGAGVNWHKVQEIGLSLVVSPLFGLALASLLVLAAKRLLRDPRLHAAPDGDKPPPGWVRALLVGTCTGVSFAHGSNDGQKGVGLIMLILIGILPADFALNTAYGKAHLGEVVATAQRVDATVRAAYGDERARSASNGGVDVPATPAGKVLTDLDSIKATLAGKGSVKDIRPEERFDLRAKIIAVDKALDGLEKAKDGKLTASQLASLKKERSSLRGITDYAPSWVLVLVALSLGVGTMIGWKRIVVTVGEKIGKSHMTYAQGASAEMVAAATIGASAFAGLPVSTTHVLSSGIAGTMLAHKSGLQGSTVRNIALAWIFTLPASTVLAGALFLLFRAIIPH